MTPKFLMVVYIQNVCVCVCLYKWICACVFKYASVHWAVSYVESHGGDITSLCLCGWVFVFIRFLFCVYGCVYMSAWSLSCGPPGLCLWVGVMWWPSMQTHPCTQGFMDHTLENQPFCISHLNPSGHHPPSHKDL